MPKIGLVGDLHGNLKGLHKFVQSYPDLNILFFTGDSCIYLTEQSAKEDKKNWTWHKEKSIWNPSEFFSSPYPIINIVGNHDDYSLIEDLNTPLPFISKKTGILQIDNIKIAYLGGIFSSVQSRLNPTELKKRNRRFFTTVEMNSLYQEKNIDIFITHLAAANILPVDHGNYLLSGLLQKLKPKYYFFGHHHLNIEKNNYIGLGNFAQDETSFKILEF